MQTYVPEFAKYISMSCRRTEILLTCLVKNMLEIQNLVASHTSAEYKQLGG